MVVQKGAQVPRPFSIPNYSTSSSPTRLLRRGALRALAFALLWWTFPLSQTPAQEGAAFQVIVHPSVSETSLSVAEVSDYFLRKVTSWKDGGKTVKPVTLTDKTLSDTFARTVHHRNGLAIRKYWQRQVFTGRGTPPPEMRTVAEMLTYVSSTPGAIGYVPAGVDLSPWEVRAIRIVGG